MDVGYLLAKHPDRLQSFALNFGAAHVVSPEALVDRCTAVLILDLDLAAPVRGRERLRLIYGPAYTLQLDRLREFALSLEALRRFVAGEPLRQVHEWVFGVLALESEPVDPRL